MMQNEDALRQALLRARRAIPDALDDAGEDVVSEMHKATGRPYPPAAPPGEPPAKRSGKLQRGWKTTHDDTALTLYNDDPKFKFPEEGTRKMKARPSLSTVGVKVLSSIVPDKLARFIEDAERRV